MDTGEPSYDTEETQRGSSYIYSLGVFSGFFLLIILFYISYICKRRARFQSPPPTAISLATNTNDTNNNHHFIILSRGLDDDVLVTFPTYVYSEVIVSSKEDVSTNTNSSECAICLSDYKPSDVIRYGTIVVNIKWLVNSGCHTPKSLTLKIHHGGWFTPIPSRSYISGHVSSVNVVDIGEFCLHDLKDMVVKLGYGAEDLMYCHFLIPSLGLDYGLHSLNVDADVLEMSKYVKDYKIILVYVEHKSSIVETIMKKLSKEQSASSVARPNVVESDVDPFDGLDEILGTSSTADDFSFGKFKEVEVEANTESKEEERDTKGNDTSGSDSEDLDYDPNHDDVYDDDEHIVKEVHVNMNNFSFTADPKHDKSIGVVDVQEDDLDVIDYDLFGSDLDGEIDSQRRIQLRELRRIGKKKNKGPNKYYFYLGQQFSSKEIVKRRVKKHSVETRRQLILVKNDNERVRVRCEGTIPALVPYVAIDTNMDKNVFSQTKGGPAIRENINSGKQNILGKDKTLEGKECIWEVRTLYEDHTCIQSRAIKACTSRFLANHVIKSLANNPDILMRSVQDQMQKQFEVGVSKMKAFRAKRIASDIITDSYREQYSLLREYAQELINQNPGTTFRIDVQQEPNPESLTRIFRRVYVCPWPGQILTAVGVDANNGIYLIAYAIVKAESKASWCWFLNLLGEDLGIESNFNYTFISNRQKEACTRRCSEMQPKPLLKVNSRKMIGELKSFNSDAYDWLMKIPLEQWSRAHFLGRAKCDLLINNICEVFNRQLVDGRDQPIITCLEYIREYLMKRIVVVQKVIAKTVGPLTPSVTKMKWELTGIPCKHVVAAIYNMSENSVGVGIPEQWVHAAYRLETWAHVYSFKVNPCNGRDMWPVVESRTVIIPPLYKPPIGRPPKKRKKSNDEIASQSASSGKLSRKVLADSVFGLCLVRSIMFG
ncbi:mutator type transposase [Tanacetum coccineum]